MFAAAGGAPIARFENETARNTFDRLPVREGENVFVWFARFDDVAAYDAYRAKLASSPRNALAAAIARAPRQAAGTSAPCADRAFAMAPTLHH